MLKEKGQTKVGLLVVFSVLTLSACGGGGSGSDKPTASELTPGVFDIGSVSRIDGSKHKGYSLLSDTGKFITVFNNYTFGNLTFSSSGKITGQVVEYNLTSSSGEPPIPGTISGQVESSVLADLTASRTSPVSDSVLYRNPELSDSGVTLEDVYGTFSMSVAGETLIIEIDAEGTLFSSDFTPSKSESELQCVLNGKVVIHDPSINVFEVTYEAENCPDPAHDGAYSGLGTFSHADHPSDDELIFYTHNDVVARMFKGSRT